MYSIILARTVLYLEFFATTFVELSPVNGSYGILSTITTVTNIWRNIS